MVKRKKGEAIPSPSSRFMKVKCEKCKNEQIIFNKPANIVKCLVCDSVLVEPKGGLINERAVKIIEVFD
ncbi:MAG: 30S ribosomal protein S27e [archaeon]